MRLFMAITDGRLRGTVSVSAASRNRFSLSRNSHVASADSAAFAVVAGLLSVLLAIAVNIATGGQLPGPLVARQSCIA